MTRRRAAAPKRPPVLRELECVILGIDSGATSGWAILSPRTLHELGAAKTAAERTGVVEQAQLVADQLGLPLIAAGEKWTAGGWKTAATPMGLSAQWGRWQEQLELAGHPKRRVVRVYPQTWRARVLGHGSARKGAAEVYVASRWPGMHVPTHDAAEAACIGTWGQRAAEVADVLPKRRTA